jgi:uncharacterized protein (TIGR02444 family)
VRLWDFATGLYAQPGVEAPCLRLQDIDGQSVPLILWRLWSLHEGREVDPETLERAVEVARTWERSVVAAERILLDALDALTPEAGGVWVDALPALRAASERWGGAPSEEGLAHLILAVSLKAPLAEFRRSATN